LLPEGICQLCVAGRLDMDHAYVNAIRRQVASSGLSGQVAFLGPLADEQLSEQLRLSQVLVVPSSYEGFGIVYLEGMGFGLPAIATSGGAAGEIITHAENGFLIAPGDAPALGDCLAALAADRQLLLELSLAAHKRFEIQPGWEQTCREIRGFLENFGRPDFGRD
jgi:glycosyltransferase involved in cell wall biosynthesis